MKILANFNFKEMLGKLKKKFKRNLERERRKFGRIYNENPKFDVRKQIFSLFAVIAQLILSEDVR